MLTEVFLVDNYRILLDQTPLSISCHSRILTVANIQVACANVNKPCDSNGHAENLRYGGQPTCEVTGRRKQGNRSEVPCSKMAADQEAGRFALKPSPHIIILC